MKRLWDESGQVMALTVLCMSVLLGSVAFAVDIGILLYTKRTLQTAADSAAIAAAQEIVYNDPVAAADADAAQNGVTAGTNGATVTVSYPDPQSAQVVVSQLQPTFFMKLFNQGSVTVTASAVATLVAPTTCVYTLGPAGMVSDITLANGANLAAPSCGILDDANGPNGIAIGPGSSLSAKTIGVVGLISGDGITPAPIIGITPFGDPLGALAPPSYNPAVCPAEAITTSQTLGPPPSAGGVACYAGLTVSNGATLTLNHGTYVIDGSSLNVSGGATVTGTGVTIYLVNSTADSVIANSTLSLVAPSAGAYSGILFYEDPSDNHVLNFNADDLSSLSGIIYLPDGQLYFAGGGGTANLNLSLVVSAVEFSDHGYNLTPYNAGASPLSYAKLTQ